MASSTVPRQRTSLVRWVNLTLGIAVVALIAARYIFGWIGPGTEGIESRADPERLRAAETAPLTVAPLGTATEDWPGWRGANRDGISTESGLQFDWPAGGPPALWRAKTGLGFSSFAVAGRRLYTLIQDGEEEVVVCWDADSGQELWRRAYATPANYVKEQRSGPRSTPTVADGKVYTVGSTGIFHCLDASTGAILWSHDLLREYGAPLPEWGVAFSPLVDGNLIYTCPGGPGGKSIVAFDKNTGKEVWKALDDPPGYSSPILVEAAGQRHLVVFTGNALAGVSPVDGTLFWRYPWDTEFQVNAATPISVGNYIFISSSYNKGCTLLEILPQGNGALTAKMVYQNNRMRNHFSSCVYHAEHLYGFSEAFLVCLALRTGEVQWKARGYGKGSLLLADGHLIVLGDAGQLAVAPATPSGFQARSSFQFSTNRCWTVPALSHGKLYVRDETDLVCFDLRKR